MDKIGFSNAEERAPRNPRALLLDLDGTLADSLPAMQSVHRRFLDAFGAKEDNVEFARLNGPPLSEVVHLLKNLHDLVEPESMLLVRYLDLVDQAYAEVSPNQGARPLLEQARIAGCIVGVVTSNSARRTRDWLERVDFSDLIDLVIGGEDVVRGKPDPEPYRLAATLAGCPVDRAVAVEDSPPGALSARKAGLHTFVLDRDPAPDSGWPEGVEKVPSLDYLAARLW